MCLCGAGGLLLKKFSPQKPSCSIESLFGVVRVVSLGRLAVEEIGGLVPEACHFIELVLWSVEAVGLIMTVRNLWLFWALLALHRIFAALPTEMYCWPEQTACQSCRNS